MIPVDVRLAKMLVLAAVFRCLDPGQSSHISHGLVLGIADTFAVLTIAALLSSKPLFTSPMDKRDQSKRWGLLSVILEYRVLNRFPAGRESLSPEANRTCSPT